jgi:phosphoadenosine phosphosulfate reductase
MRHSAAEIAARAEELDQATPAEILAFALTTWAPRVAISTAFGVEGCALVDMAVKIDPAVQIFTVDTGYLFAETKELERRLAERYGVTITTFAPALTVAEQERRFGKLYEIDGDRCCALRKVEPTQRALAGLDCWIAGLRRDQGPSRAGIRVLELLAHADGTPLVKVHPLARLTRADVWRYVLRHDVPYNPLLDQGYASIGCWPCTRPVEAGEAERAGRWGGQKAECGIHEIGVRRGVAAR